MHSGSNKKGSDLVKITFVLMKNHEERNLERKSLFVHLKRYITVHNQRKLGQEIKQSRDMEAGAETDAMEE